MNILRYAPPFFNSRGRIQQKSKTSKAVKKPRKILIEPLEQRLLLDATPADVQGALVSDLEAIKGIITSVLNNTTSNPNFQNDIAARVPLIDKLNGVQLVGGNPVPFSQPPQMSDFLTADLGTGSGPQDFATIFENQLITPLRNTNSALIPDNASLQSVLNGFGAKTLFPGLNDKLIVATVGSTAPTSTSPITISDTRDNNGTGILTTEVTTSAVIDIDLTFKLDQTMQYLKLDPGSQTPSLTPNFKLDLGKQGDLLGFIVDPGKGEGTDVHLDGVAQFHFEFGVLWSQKVDTAVTYTNGTAGFTSITPVPGSLTTDPFVKPSGSGEGLDLKGTVLKTDNNPIGNGDLGFNMRLGFIGVHATNNGAITVNPAVHLGFTDPNNDGFIYLDGVHTKTAETAGLSESHSGSITAKFDITGALNFGLFSRSGSITLGGGPFDSTVQPVAGELDTRTAPTLTQSGSGLDDLLFFTNITPDTAMNLIEQFTGLPQLNSNDNTPKTDPTGGWLNNMETTSSGGQVPFLDYAIPFTQGKTLASVLNFAEGFFQKVVNFNQDAFNSNNGLLDQDTTTKALFTNFTSAQNLKDRLAGLPDSSVFQGANYDAMHHLLTFHVKFDYNFPDQTGLPISFNLPLDGLGAINTTAKVTLDGIQAHVDLTFGFDLSNPAGVTLSASVRPNVPLPSNGQLSSDATFSILFGATDPTVKKQVLDPITMQFTTIAVPIKPIVVPVPVTVSMSATAGNSGVNDLVKSVQDAVDNALGGIVNANKMALAAAGIDLNHLKVTVGQQNGVITFTASNDANNAVIVGMTADPTNTAATQIGVLSGQPFTPSNGVLTHPDLVAFPDAGLDFWLDVGNQSKEIKLRAADTLHNTNIDQLVSEIQGAIDAQFGAGFVTVARNKIGKNLQGNLITFTTTNATVLRIRSNNNNDIATDLGFFNDPISRAQTDIFFVNTGNNVFKGDVHLQDSGGIGASADFGYLGIQTKGGGADLTGHISLSLKDPGTDNDSRIDLNELFGALTKDDSGTSGAALKTLISGSITGTGNLGTNTAVSLIHVTALDSSNNDFLGLGSLGTVNIELPNFGDLSSLKVVPTDTRLNDFLNVNFTDVAGAIAGIDQFVGAIQLNTKFLTDPLPLTSLNLGKTLDFDTNIANAVTAFTNNPALTVQNLVQHVYQALGISKTTYPNAVKVEYVPSDHALKISLNLTAGFDKTLPINFNLFQNTANPLTLSGAAGLSASAQATASLVFGIDLTNSVESLGFDGNQTGTGLVVANHAVESPFGTAIKATFELTVGTTTYTITLNSSNANLATLISDLNTALTGTGVTAGAVSVKDLGFTEGQTGIGGLGAGSAPLDAGNPIDTAFVLTVASALPASSKTYAVHLVSSNKDQATLDADLASALSAAGASKVRVGANASNLTLIESIHDLGFTTSGQSGTTTLTAADLPQVPFGTIINTAFDLTVGTNRYSVALGTLNTDLTTLRTDLKNALGSAGVHGVTVGDNGSGKLTLNAATGTGLSIASKKLTINSVPNVLKLTASSPSTPIVIDHQFFIYNNTGLTFDARVFGQNLNFTAAVGPVGLQVNGGIAVLDRDGDPGTTDPAEFTVKLPQTQSRYSLHDLAANLSSIGNLTTSLNGKAHAQLPLYFPTSSNFLTQFDFQVNDLSNPANAQITPNDLQTQLSNLKGQFNSALQALPLTVDGVDSLLSSLQNALNVKVFDPPLPLVGDKLTDAAQFIESFRENLVSQIRDTLDKAPALAADAVKTAIWNVLGNVPGGANIIQNKPGDPDGVADKDDIVLNVDESHVEFDMTLGQDYLAALPTGFDLGLPALNLKAAGGIAVDVNWSLPFGFGVDNGGFYFVIPQVPNTATYSLPMTIGADVKPYSVAELGFANTQSGTGALIALNTPIGTPFHTVFTLMVDRTSFDIKLKTNNSSLTTLENDLTSALAAAGVTGVAIGDDGSGKLKLTASNLSTPLSVTGFNIQGSLAILSVLVSNNGGTDFGATFKVKINDDNDHGRMRLDEIGNLDIDATLSGDAKVDLDLLAGFGTQGVVTSFPTIEVHHFTMDWNFGTGIGADSTDTNSSLEDWGKKAGVAFDDVTINMGTFISDFLKPIFDKIRDVGDPIKPVLDVLTYPIPVLSQLSGSPVSLLTIAMDLGLAPPGTDTVASILDQLINISDDFAGLTTHAGAQDAGLEYQLGSFDLSNLSGGGGDLLTAASSLDLIPGMKFDFSATAKALEDAFNSGDPVAATAKLLDQMATQIGGSTFGGFVTNVTDFITSGLSYNKAENGLPKFTDFEMHFPLFEHPSDIFKLLLGQGANIDLFTMQLPTFGFDFPFHQFLPIWGPLGVAVDGDVGAHINLGGGYDLSGLLQFANEGFRTDAIHDIFYGFYIGTTRPVGSPPAPGNPIFPLADFEAGLGIAAELNAGVASAGVEAKFEAEIDLLAHDPDGDGRFHLNEIISDLEIGYDIIKHDVGGNPFLAGLGAPLGLFDFHGQFDLRLFAYIDALFGAWHKEFNLVPPITLLDFNASVAGAENPVLAEGHSTNSSATDPNPIADGLLRLNIGPYAKNRINGDTSDGNETIYLKHVSGTAGDEEIAVWSDVVSEANAQHFDHVKGIVIDGGAGNDHIEFHASGGYILADATVMGGAGDDTIDLRGLAGHATVHGGTGNDTIMGGGDPAHLIGEVIYGDEGADTITGGPGPDTIFGGAGDDSIDGGPGNDIILGGDGTVDTSHGTPVVKLAGASGNDILKGGAGNDLIYGDDGDDYIEGNAGQDTIYGGAGNDTVHGGTENDLIYGEAGMDKLFGDAGGDVIIGGADTDAIIGGSGNDYLFGDDASVTIDASGHLISFTLQGGNGNDVILGDDGDVDLSTSSVVGGVPQSIPKITLTSGIGGDDTVYGEDGADIIYGQEGNDHLYGNRDNDSIFGNAGDDYIDGGTGNDVLFGDDGQVTYVSSQIALYNLQLKTIDPLVTGNDEIHGGAGDDIIFGGPNSGTGQDKITGDEGKDLIFGDMGQVDFDWTLQNGSLIKTAKTTDFGTGGSDLISGGADSDIIFGGSGGDTIYGDHDLSNAIVNHPGNDIIIGDQGEVDFNTSVKLNQIKEIYTTDLLNTDGGNDNINGNEGNDIILGGVGGDTIQADGNDILLGDEGILRYDVAPGEVIAGLGAIPASVGDNNLSTLDLVQSIPVVGGVILGGNDTISGGPGTDLVIGGVGGDTIYGDGSPVSPTTVTVTQMGFNNGQTATGTLTALNLPLASGIQVNTSFDLTVGPTIYAVSLISSNSSFKGLKDDLSAALTLAGATGVTVGDDGSGHLKLTASDLTKKLTIATDVDQSDLLVGDNAITFLAGGFNGTLVFQGSAVAKIMTTDTAENTGGPDIISGNAGADIIFGGVNNGGTDYLYGDRAVPDAASIAADGDDVIIGDNGYLDFNSANTNTAIPLTLTLIRSAQDGLGGSDVISGNAGSDVVIGGTGNDTIYGDDSNASAASADGNDILIGDNADIFLVDKGNASGGDLKLVRGKAVMTIRTTDNINPSLTGGSDNISGNAGGDILIGGVGRDFLYGDRAVPTAATTALDGNDIMLGDNGALEWLSTGRLSEISGIDIAGNNPALWAKFSAGAADTDLTTLDLITTEQPTNGGRDVMYGDAGSDVMFGGTDADIMYGDDGTFAGSPTNNDLMFGDHGRLYPHYSFEILGTVLVAEPAFSGQNARNFFSIDTGPASGGEGDQMYGEEGNDIMIGGQGDDRMFGGLGDDEMIGGHNVSGGWDELGAAGVVQNTIGGAAANDFMDGGAGNDAMAGDNAIIWRRADDLSPRFRALTAATIYSTTINSITTNVGTTNQSDPADSAGRDIQLLDHSFDVQANPLGRFGNDVMAGGAGNDVMFGELGNDLMEGDGLLGKSADTTNPFNVRILVTTDSGVPGSGGTLYYNVPEAATDGDDYMEGNGGSDTMYGGLGQDDMIGGSSELFGLTTAAMRPDSSDYIFGGAGDHISRNDPGDATVDANGNIITNPGGHARDADFIMGDNGDIYRLVKGGASGTNPNDPNDVFLTFNYDDPTLFPGNGYSSLRIIPRAMKELDYTLGGADYAGGGYTANGAANNDNGAADVIHGESGDDVIFGETGSDVIFGDGQDDAIVGGYGNDWISGGTGNDGILGSDGLVYISRNSTIGEPLYGVAGLLAKDPDPKNPNGNVLNEVISTPGQIQYAVINKSGDLKMSMDMVPFSFDPTWIGTDDEYPNNANNTPFDDDILFGGLGNDSVHGGSGDDAISGAEALDHAYVPNFDSTGNPIGIIDLGFSAVGVPAQEDPGNVLAFNPVDKGGVKNNRFRAGEFFLYDEYDPLRKIQLDSTGHLWKDPSQGTAYEFLLNFNPNEGVLRPGGTTTSNGQTINYPAVNDDGEDALFGDNGNDWIVGGTGRDDMYGGWGNDLINADDNQSTDGNLNDQPDTQPYFEDRAYGGAGRDVLIANTGGDRLIDWVGEYNTYLVPYAPFGEASVSRTLQPFLQEFLYALSKGDGADQSRPTKTGSDPLRNGEPAAEMGLVLQKDSAWQAQTGAPSDPQAGNIPGGQRDVLRTASFDDPVNPASNFYADTGNWAVVNGRYQVGPAVAGGDGLSVFDVNAFVPSYFEMLATVNAVKPTAGLKANAYLVFDYYSSTDFKFAGIDVATNQLEIGHRNATGWIVDKQAPFPGSLTPGTDYNLFLSVNGTAVTLIVNNKISLSFAFAPRVDVYGISHNINDGMVGLGANNSVAQLDNVVVQRLAPTITFNQTVNFSSGTTSLLNPPEAGTWTLSGGRYAGAPGTTTPAVDLVSFVVSPAYLIDLSATFNTSGEGGLVYDHYAVNNFKFVTIKAGVITLGHVTSKGWFTDAVVNKASLVNGTDYTLEITLTNSTVNVLLNGSTVTSYVYNALVTDGNSGLLSRTGTTSFKTVTVKSNDPGLANLTFTSPAVQTSPLGESPLGLIDWQTDSKGESDWQKAVDPVAQSEFAFVGSDSIAIEPHQEVEWLMDI